MTRSLDELQRGQHRHTLALHFGGGGKSESMAIDVLRVLDVVRLASSCYHRLVFCDSAITRTFTSTVVRVGSCILHTLHNEHSTRVL
jgi:hypothetical protein